MQDDHIRLAGRAVPYTVTVSDRARHPRLIIAPGTGLRVVIPRGYTHALLHAFIARHERWVLKHLDRLAAQPARPGADVPLPRTLRVLGSAYRLDLAVTADDRPGVAARGATLTVTAPDNATARAMVAGWLRAAARTAIAARVAERARAMGVTYGRIAIRDQRTRWGSCSRAGNLNFNWRLVLAPPAVLDYVVVHELAHRIELNHSPRFWAIVARHCPEHEALRAWLRTNGATLHL